MTDEYHLSILTRESMALPDDDDDDGPLSLSLGQKSVTTVICWMVMVALRSATRRRASTVSVSESQEIVLWSILDLKHISPGRLSQSKRNVISLS